MATSKKTQPIAAPKQQMNQWEINEAMMTLQRAEQIKQDKKLMSGVKRNLANLGKVVNKTSTRK